MLLHDIISSHWKLRFLQILHQFDESDLYEFLHQLGQQRILQDDYSTAEYMSDFFVKFYRLE